MSGLRALTGMDLWIDRKEAYILPRIGAIVGASTAMLVGVMMLLTMVPMSALAASTPYVFFTEGAEQPTFAQWDARWSKFDANTASSLDYWCRQGHEVHTGTHAAFCARSGYNSHYLNTASKQPMDVNITGLTGSFNIADQVLRYDTNEDAIMRKSIGGAKNYNNIALSFWFYSDTGKSNAVQPSSKASVGYDFLNVVYYTGSNSSLTKHVLWTDTEAQARAKAWTQVTLGVPNNMTWIGFEFVSGTTAPVGGDAPNAFSAYGIRTTPAGSTGMKEGVFIDDITLTGTDVTAPIVKITSPTSGAVVGKSSVTVNWTASDSSGVAYSMVKLDSGSFINVNSARTYTYSGVANGNHTLTVQAFDTTGNSKLVTVKFAVKV
jgi:hypothetical protein